MTQEAAAVKTTNVFEKQILEKERFIPVATLTFEDKKIRYYTPSLLSLWRVKTIYSKEPETIEWLAGMAKDDVLIDVGANVGMYTLWGAITRGIRVYAFEPESQNYAILNKNILANDLSSQVTAYCVALSDKEEFSVLNLGELLAGGSNHTFKDEVDFKLQERQPVFKQGCFATTLDRLVADKAVALPQHIKIDVDGIEHKVIAGMKDTLKNPGVKSLLVELNTLLSEHRAIIDMMTGLGFTYSKEKVQQSLDRQKGKKFEGVANHIFTRERK